MMIEPMPTRMEEGLTSDPLDQTVWEESFPSFPPQHTSTHPITMNTTISSNDAATDVWKWSCINNRLTIGSDITSTNGLSDQSQPTWNGTEFTQTYLDTNSFHSYPSSTTITSDMEPVINTLCIPYTTDNEEELLLGGVTSNYNRSGEETLMPTCYPNTSEPMLGPSLDGSWDSSLLQLLTEVPATEIESTLTNIYSRYHRVNHELEPTDQVAVATVASIASWESLLSERVPITLEELMRGIDRMVEDNNEGDNEIEMPMQDDLDNLCAGQTTYELQSSQSTKLTMAQSTTPFQPTTTMIMGTTVREEEGDDEEENGDSVDEDVDADDEGVEWTDDACQHRTEGGVMFYENGQWTAMAYKEGLERARRNLREEFDLKEAYSLGKLIRRSKKVSRLASQYLGRHYKTLATSVYQLYRGYKGQWDLTLGPKDYVRMTRKERSRRRQGLYAQKLSSE